MSPGGQRVCCLPSASGVSQCVGLDSSDSVKDKKEPEELNNGIARAAGVKRLSFGP